MSRAAEAPDDALTAFALACIDPAGLRGVRVAAHGGIADGAWMEAALSLLPERAPRLRVNPGVPTARLLGGLDGAASLASGMRIIEAGILAGASGGVLILPMAERLPRATAAIMADCIETGVVRTEREGVSARLATCFVLLALDEGVDDESVPAVLAETLAFRCTPGRGPFRVPGRAEIDAARVRLPSVTMPDDIEEALAALSLAASMRPALHLMRAARAAAALAGSPSVRPDDAALAMRLVLGATAIADLAAEQPRHAPPEEDRRQEGQHDTDAGEAEGDPPPAEMMADVILAAAAASLPDDVLAAGSRLSRGRGSAQSGRSDVTTLSARGAAIGTAPRPPRPDARVDLISTLRAAVPWQRLRKAGEGRVAIRAADLRYVRRRERQGATAIIALDASGSAAATRLAETKGAVELLLAQCYVRRDEVALIAFRGDGAELVLEPTRSLVRAKRALAGLPGGGPTPLAHGIAAAAALSDRLERRGRRPVTVFLTDGRGNVALDGSHGRGRATDDALAAARRFRAMRLSGVVIDTGMRPQPALAALAAQLGADYVALPRGGSARIASDLALRLKG